MNKQIVITALLLLVCLTGLAKKEVVWETPSAFMGNQKSDFIITKVELKPTETVLHFSVNYYPDTWIRFAKESFLQTPDGTKYPITSGVRTCEDETDLTLDSLFWMPKSGKAKLALHFKPAPLDTKQMDFIEGYNANDFRFWNICDSKNKVRTPLPADWQGVKYAADETLPAAKINKGVARIKVRLLNYKPAMKLSFFVYGFKPLGSTEQFEKEYRFADDGTLTAEVPLWLTREVTIGINGLAQRTIVVAPGQETSILMDINDGDHPFVAFKGFLAKTNMDLMKADEMNYINDANTYLRVRECKTPAERLKCLTDIFNHCIATSQKSKFTTAAKDLLCMRAEERFVAWTRDFTAMFSPYYTDEEGKVGKSYTDLEQKMMKNKNLLMLPDEKRPYRWRYLNEPGSPCSRAFWSTRLIYRDGHAGEKNAYNVELQTLSSILGGEESTVEKIVSQMKFDDCKAVYREYAAEQRRIAQQLSKGSNIFYKKLDDVAPGDILKTILDQYRGTTVVVDLWATWCGPCRAGHQAMKPMKEQMKSDNIKFIYITSPSSPLKTWQEMIKSIDGDHYYLTNEQYDNIINHYESDGIPTYAIYNPQGEQTFKSIGFPGVEKMKEEIEKAEK